MDINPIEPTNTETTTLENLASLAGTVAIVLIGERVVKRLYRGVGNRAVRKAEKAQKNEAKKTK
jgi:hypothetical protein